MSREDFGAHFEEAIKAAASRDDSTAIKRAEFFLPPTEELDQRVDAIIKRIVKRVDARRMDEVDAWVRREMTPHLGAEVCALPADEFAAALYEAGVYGAEQTFKDDAPGVMRFVLYGRTEGDPVILATMTFEPTFEPKP